MRLPLLLSMSLLLAACGDDNKDTGPGPADSTPDYADADGDGYDESVDCDDNDPYIHPDTTEVCTDGLDNDCDGQIDEADADCQDTGDTGGEDLSVDSDLDGYPAATDCDDDDPSVHPDADELCDGIDNDCDDEIDEDEAFDARAWYLDADEDGYPDAAQELWACYQPEGYLEPVLDEDEQSLWDCNDEDPAIHPLADETCNAVDDDCDEVVDEGDALDATLWYLDADGDGYGDPDVRLYACEQPSGYITDGSDCDDGRSSTYPGADEYCDGMDDDCDGATDEDDAVDQVVWYVDADGDGFGSDSEITAVLACQAPSSQYLEDGSDCDDSDGAVHPGADEFCNGADDDCDGTTDESDARDVLTWYRDNDGDGYGDSGATSESCLQPSGYSAYPWDCDDSDGAVNPDATEICDHVDNNCSGEADETGTSGELLWHLDHDGDGYGDASYPTWNCWQPSSYVSDNTDCDDMNADANPAATEVCDPLDVDEDCDTLSDQDDASVDPSTQLTYYSDDDGDGFGDEDDAGALYCQDEQPTGWLTDASDCDDTRWDISPLATELCDGVDNDCDGTTDEADAYDAITWYQDADGDGYSVSTSTVACYQPSGYIETLSSPVDCDDGDAWQGDGSSETFGDGHDNDCDGLVDENVSFTTVQTLTLGTGADPIYHIVFNLSDGDSYLDMAVAGYGDQTFYLYRGMGSGLFDSTSIQTVSTNHNVRGVATGFINGGSNDDLVAVTTGTSTNKNKVYSIFTNGSGTIKGSKNQDLDYSGSSGSYSNSDARSVKLLSCDPDDTDELLLVGENDSGDISYWLSDGGDESSISYTKLADLDVTSGSQGIIHMRKVQLDGLYQEDIIVSSRGDSSFAVIYHHFNNCSSSMNVGAADYTLTRYDGPQAAAAEAADLDEDDHQDIALSGYDQGKVWIYLGSSSGAFTAGTAVDLSGTTCYGSGSPHLDGLDIGDFNDDGHQDIAVVCAAYGKIALLMGFGDGTFHEAHILDLDSASDPREIVVKDLDGDSDVDIIVSLLGSDTVQVLHNDLY